MDRAARERIAALDLIRGVAVLGILAVNVAGFAGPPSASYTPAIPLPASRADEWAFAVMLVLFEGKMRALFSLLFMQLAVAGYVCPVDAKVAEADVMAEAAMPCAGEMTKVDAEQPGLCHAHCQSAQQTVEKAQTPTPAVAVATGFTYTIEPVRPSLPRQPAQAPSLMRSTAPPIAVRNCCFRI